MAQDSGLADRLDLSLDDLSLLLLQRTNKQVAIDHGKGQMQDIKVGCQVNQCKHSGGLMLGVYA